MTSFVILLLNNEAILLHRSVKVDRVYNFLLDAMSVGNCWFGDCAFLFTCEIDGALGNRAISLLLLRLLVFFASGNWSFGVS